MRTNSGGTSFKRHSLFSATSKNCKYTLRLYTSWPRSFDTKPSNVTSLPVSRLRQQLQARSLLRRLVVQHVYCCCYFPHLWCHFHVRTDSIDTKLGYKLKVSRSRRAAVDLRSTNSYTEGRKGHMTPDKTYETSGVKWILSHSEKCARMFMAYFGTNFTSGIIIIRPEISSWPVLCSFIF